MSSGGESLGLLQWVVGGLAFGGGAALGLMWRHFNLELDKVWTRITTLMDEHARDRLEDARNYATQASLAELGQRFDDALERHEKRMLAAITNRGPVRGPNE